MISLPLSVLDIAMIEQGRSSTEALRATVGLAAQVEAWGYRRFWVAEHHRSRSSASSVPAVLIAQIAATTKRIHVGSGGVMLTNHSPLAVAEEFSMLRALHPGRIDVGVGRGSGTRDPDVIRALRRGAPPADGDEYGRSVKELVDLMAGGPADMSPDGGPWLLSSSGAGATLAAALGLPLVVAHHIRPDQTSESVRLYRRNFKASRRLDHPYVMVSVTAVCADTVDRAELLARPAIRYFAASVLGGGDMESFATVAEMAARGLTEAEHGTADLLVRTQAIGDADRVVKQLVDLAATTGADELMLMTPVYEPADRARSFELVMRSAVREHTRASPG